MPCMSKNPMTNVTKGITCHVNIKLLEIIMIEFIWHGAVLYLLTFNFIKNRVSFKCCLAENKFIGRILLLSFLFAETKPKALGIREE